MKIRISTILILAFGCLLNNEVKAQEQYTDLPKISIGIGYFGQHLAHPGINLHGEFALNKDEIQMLTRINLIHYKHTYYIKNWMLMEELVFRKYVKNFNYWETSLGTAYLYQNTDATLYEYNNDLFKDDNSGKLGIAPSFGIRYGYLIKLPNGGVIAPNIGGRILYEYPFSDVDLFRGVIDISTTYKLK